MKRMSASNVLIVGLDGLGVEIGEHPSLISTSAGTDSLSSKKHCPRRCQVFDYL